MASLDEHCPKNPSAKPTELSHSPDRTAASAEPLWHQPLAQQRHLDRDNCRVQENERPDHEAKRVAGEPNPEEERELPATPGGPDTPQEHYIEISSSSPHPEVYPISVSPNICNRAPTPSRPKRLRNYRRTPPEKGKTPVVSHSFSDLSGSNEEVIANDSGNDNFQEVYYDADSGSYNGPSSPKTASHSW